jgi:hypothetical protein
MHLVHTAHVLNFRRWSFSSAATQTSYGGLHHQISKPHRFTEIGFAGNHCDVYHGYSHAG